ncbi:DUF1700 domain-containing protein [Vagococcus sp. PNs007]|uniref:DUF1700 domain-containing protein n=1 Tax=Vagococcus proximus TaxID=2991417 RepID=A0ABT5X3T5_9ENTE|nr:DUF1700 domain-containing protein [Vagococcus proximus]MDF0480645.1 DUF1700 domain-containing protein [Vagococcus proximus]
MNKEHFLTELKIKLRPLPKKEQAYFLHLYNDKFNQLLDEGLEEVYVSKQLGHPQHIAEEILKEYGIKPTDYSSEKSSDWQEFSSSDAYDDHPYYQSFSEQQKKPASFFIRFCQVAGVLLFNGLFMIWMIFGALALLFGIWLTVLILTLSPLIGIVAFFLNSGAMAMFQIFASIALSGIGVIGLALLIPITKAVTQLLKHYTTWNLRLLRGEH